MKTAVVVFNLGGPESLKGVPKYLFSLFSDKAIIPLPQPFRSCVALLLSWRRASTSREIYETMGGRSPLLRLTRLQAEALEKNLRAKGEYRTFVAMRHSRPQPKEVITEIKAYGADRIVLLPLYPQFSTTTTQSFFDAWYSEAGKQGLKAPHHPVCCYPFDNHFTDAHVELLKSAYNEAIKFGPPRILFSAHGLPKKIVDGGDPYVWQVERTVAAIMRKFGAADHVICYQSRLSALTWTGPGTDEEIERAGRDRVPLVVVPVAFVSEHSETLVELDVEYKALANKNNVPHYVRVAALSSHPQFIETLAWLVEATKLYPNCSNSLGRICPKEKTKCGFREWR